MKKKDERLTYFTNVVENIEYVKMRSLENYFCMKIFKKREEELKYLEKYNVGNGILFAFAFASTAAVWVSIVWYIHYYYVGALDFGEFNVLLAIVFTISNAVGGLMLDFTFFYQNYPSVARINKFINLDIGSFDYLVDVTPQNDTAVDTDLAIATQGGNFSWHEYIYPKNEALNKPRNTQNNIEDSSILDSLAYDSEYGSILPGGTKAFELKDLNLKIKKGENVVILGDSGSGKTSLLYALCGEMYSLPSSSDENDSYSDKSKIYKQGTVGILTENRFTKAGSILDNILLEKDLDEDILELALVSSQLKSDLDTMENGINTMLSDTNDVISGGQKARICLARTFYQQ